MNILVTGGCGFIGSHIVNELVKRNFKVRVIDNLSTGDIKNITDVLDKIEFVEADITDLSHLKDCVKDVDCIIHQAALPSVARSIKAPLDTNASNITGTLNVLQAARELNVKRVIFASSSSVYGDTPKLPKREDMQPQPKSPYALSKLTGEYYCKLFHNLYGLETVCLRYFNVFGPRQNPHSEYSAVIPKFIKSAILGQRPVIYGTGIQSRDFTYVENVVYANLLAIETPDAAGNILNIACGRKFSLLELINFLSEIFGRKIEVIFDEPKPGDILHSLADINKAKEILKYQPKISFEEGLKSTVEWMQKNVCLNS